jgi:hypothetical protein
MAYTIKDNPIHGKLLADSNNKIVITDYKKAVQLAENFSGINVLKAGSGRFMVQLPEYVNSIEECDCQNNDISYSSGMPNPQSYNQYPDHEVQMARQELYRTAKLAMMTHELLKQVGERQGLEGWVQSKLTRAADYIETVYGYLDYEMRYPSEMYESAPVKKNTGRIKESIKPITPLPRLGPAPRGMEGSPITLSTEDPQNPGRPPIRAEKVPGMVKMVAVDDNGQAEGPPIDVPGFEVALKQKAGYKVIGEMASAGASSAGGMAGGPVAGAGSLFGGNFQQRGNPFRKKKKKVREVIMKPEDMSDEKQDRINNNRPEDTTDIINRMKTNRAMDTFQSGMPDILKQVKKVRETDDDPLVKNLPPINTTGDNSRTAKLAAAATGSTAATPAASNSRKSAQDFMKMDTKESSTGPKFTGYWKGTDKGKPGKKMVGSN